MISAVRGFYFFCFPFWYNKPMKLKKLIVVLLVFLMMGFNSHNKYPSPFNPLDFIQKIEIPFTVLPYSTKNLQTFAAQVFNYPITQANFNAYLDDFHYDTTRIIISGFESDQPGACLESLKRNTSTYKKIWKKNDSLIFNISKMPKWLSDSSDERPLEIDQGWKAFHAHQPKDYTAWKAYISSVVGYLKTIQPPGKTAYFEIWNEPDLDYWLDTTDAFLKLFTSTVEAVREADPNAKVGGPAVCSFYGKIDDNRKFLITEILEHCQQKKLHFDFLSFHLFTYTFYEDLESATVYIQNLLKTLTYAYSPELMVTEWNSPSEIRGTKSSCAAMMNGYYSFWKFGIKRHTWAAWEDFNIKTPNDYGLLSREKGDDKRGIERPVYWVFSLLDHLSKNSSGTFIIEDPSGFKLVISKTKDSENEYQCIGWNFINDPDVRAVFYIIKAIPLDELINDYKTSETIRNYIHLGKSINGKRDKEFKDAYRLYKEDLNAQDAVLDYEFTISGVSNYEIKNSESIRSIRSNKIYQKKGNILKMQIQNNEVISFTILLYKQQAMQQ